MQSPVTHRKCTPAFAAMHAAPPLIIPASFARPRAASLSRDVPAPVPHLVHTLAQPRTSVLSISTDGARIYSGSQSQHIAVRRPSPVPAP